VNKACFPPQNWGKIRGTCSASVLHFRLRISKKEKSEPLERTAFERAHERNFHRSAVADPPARRAEPGVRPGGIKSQLSLWKRLLGYVRGLAVLARPGRG